jgi:hypothetical protein
MATCIQTRPDPTDQGYRYPKAQTFLEPQKAHPVSRGLTDELLCHHTGGASKRTISLYKPSMKCGTNCAWTRPSAPLAMAPALTNHLHKSSEEADG